MEKILTKTFNIQPTKAESKADSIGIIASILCAIHCALTPVLLILMPTFGKAWAHPATHWAMALIVIPIAVFMLVKGHRQHKKKWILYLGGLGIILIIIGAILPYTKIGTDTATTATSAVSSPIEQAIAGGGG